MNKIIEKCIEELAKDEPRLDYVRGMLETVLEFQKPVWYLPKDNFVGIVGDADNRPQYDVALEQAQAQMAKPTDEASILDAKAKAALEKVKAMSHIVET